MAQNDYKTVRLKIGVYTRLVEFQGKGETLSEAVERLLSIIAPIREASEMINRDRQAYKVLHGER